MYNFWWFKYSEQIKNPVLSIKQMRICFLQNFMLLGKMFRTLTTNCRLSKCLNFYPFLFNIYSFTWRCLSRPWNNTVPAELALRLLFLHVFKSIAFLSINVTSLPKYIVFIKVYNNIAHRLNCHDYLLPSCQIKNEKSNYKVWKLIC